MKFSKMKAPTAITLLLLATLLTAGCGNGTGGKTEAGGAVKGTEGEAAAGNEPVTLTFYRFFAGLTDSEFDEYFAQPVKKKWPNVTLKLVIGQKQGPTSPDNIVATGENPDLIFTSNYSIAIFKRAQMPLDLNAYIKKANFDMNRIDPAILDALKKYSDKGETYAIPFSMNFAALFYNKDIFDKFGVPYPKELSTWDDIIELTKKLARNDGGTQYRGIVPPKVKQLGDQFSLTYVDKATNKATANNDQWKKIMDFYVQLCSIPGVLDDKLKAPVGAQFIQDKTAAMFPNFADGAVPKLQDLEEQGQPMNWDMTTYPSFKELPGVGRLVDFHLLMVSRASQHQELAFNIIKYVTSDEMQLEMTKNSRMTMLNNNEMKKHFGDNLSSMKGKNLAAALKTKLAKINPTDYDSIVSDLLNAAGTKVIQGKTDANTSLRETQDAADKAIQEMLAQ
jgi:multiple sugar transport system substrate-binding protein